MSRTDENPNYYDDGYEEYKEEMMAQAEKAVTKLLVSDEFASEITLALAEDFHNNGQAKVWDYLGLTDAHAYAWCDLDRELRDEFTSLRYDHGDG